MYSVSKDPHCYSHCLCLGSAMPHLARVFFTRILAVVALQTGSRLQVYYKCPATLLIDLKKQGL